MHLRYSINDEMTVLIFDNKPKVLQTSLVHNFISNELYEKHFLIWLSYVTDCYDEHQGRVSIYRSVKVGKANLIILKLLFNIL